MAGGRGRTRIAWRSALVVAAAGGIAACQGTTGLVLGARSSSSDAGSPPLASADDAGTESIVLDGDSSTPLQGGTGGTSNTDICPGDEVVLGFNGALTAPSVGITLIGAVQVVCGSLTSNGGVITSSPGATLSTRGASTTDPWTRMCPSDEVVVGFSGTSGDDFDEVAFVCAGLDVSDGGVLVGATTTLPAVGGEGSNAYDDGCPAGAIARGAVTLSGDWVNAFGLVCGAPAPIDDAGS